MADSRHDKAVEAILNRLRDGLDAQLRRANLGEVVRDALQHAFGETQNKLDASKPPTPPIRAAPSPRLVDRGQDKFYSAVLERLKQQRPLTQGGKFAPSMEPVQKAYDQGLVKTADDVKQFAEGAHQAARAAAQAGQDIHKAVTEWFDKTVKAVRETAAKQSQQAGFRLVQRAAEPVLASVGKKLDKAPTLTPVAPPADRKPVKRPTLEPPNRDPATGRARPTKIPPEAETVGDARKAPKGAPADIKAALAEALGELHRRFAERGGPPAAPGGGRGKPPGGGPPVGLDSAGSEEWDPLTNLKRAAGRQWGHLTSGGGRFANFLGGLNLGQGKAALGSLAGTLFADPSEKGGGQRFGNIMGGALDTAGNVAGMVGGPIGMAAGGLLKLGGAAFKAIESLRAWGDKLHEANMKFAEFSASMTQVQVEQEIREMYLSQERGERRADSARRLAESKSALDRKLAPLEDMVANFQNDIAATLNRTLVATLDVLSGRLPNLAGADGEVGGETLAAETFRIGEAQWIQEYGRPARFNV